MSVFTTYGPPDAVKGGTLLVEWTFSRGRTTPKRFVTIEVSRRRGEALLGRFGAGRGISRPHLRGRTEESRLASARALAGSRIRVAVLYGAPFFSRSATP